MGKSVGRYSPFLFLREGGGGRLPWKIGKLREIHVNETLQLYFCYQIFFLSVSPTRLYINDIMVVHATGQASTY
jgi:hypothetical protein